MDRYVSPTLFSANFSKAERDVPRAQPVYGLTNAGKIGFKEDWLQTAIQETPRLVIDPCTEAELTDESWWFWAREFGTAAGSIDVLLVSETGRVAIVETKLSINPDKRRGVLAQVLDYAVSLPKVERRALPHLPEAAGVHVDQVYQRIQKGDFLLIVAGDLLDSRAVRLGRALLGDHVVNEWVLAMVEVAVFERIGTPVPEYILVPHLRGGIETELRQIIKVEVALGDKNSVSVRSPTPDEVEASVREKWTEDRFLSALAASSLPPVYKTFGKDLRALRDEFPGTALNWGTGKNGSVTVKRNGHGLLEFYLDGRLGIRTERPPLAVGAAGGEAYLGGLRKLFPAQMEYVYPYFVPADPDMSLPAILDLLRTALKAAESAPP